MTTSRGLARYGQPGPAAIDAALPDWGTCKEWPKPAAWPACGRLMGRTSSCCPCGRAAPSRNGL
eukprot:11824588-Alexandrium_andersonii.AAC.1